MSEPSHIVFRVSKNHITSRRELHSISGLYTRLLLSDLIFSDMHLFLTIGPLLAFRI